MKLTRRPNALVQRAGLRLTSVTDPVGAEYEDNIVAGANGAFQFINVPPGDYDVDANVSGYFVQSGTSLTLASGQTLTNRDVALMKPKPRASDPSRKRQPTWGQLWDFTITAAGSATRRIGSP